LPIDPAPNLQMVNPSVTRCAGTLGRQALPLLDRAPSNFQRLESALGGRSPKLEFRVCGDGLEILARWRVCLEV
jgi:hypothetical protein